jgi:acetyltransferase-like isoleucine patch superfamily enzyme
MAGSVVTKSVPPMRIVGGNPAADIGPRAASLRTRSAALLVRALTRASTP